MSTEEKMTIHERRKYLRLMQRRYLRADRRGRSVLLDEMEQVTGLHRKSLIRLLHSDLRRRPRRQQRGRTYGVDVDDALRVIAESTDYICAERLQPNLLWLAEHLAQHGELTLTDTLRAQLTHISLSTVRRILHRIRQDEPRLPQPGPKPANRLVRDIPMRRIPWNTQQPGHFEVDLVHHGGSSPTGEFMYTLQMIDVATGWSERVAILGRSYRVMQAAFVYILARLPFPVLELHPDNGAEFLNAHLLRFWREILQPPRLSRSRPYHKNDNRFVEQKNRSLVRAFLGRERLDAVPQVIAANTLYDHMWLYYNFFQPVMRVREKAAVTTPNGSTRFRPRHDQAQTPFDRLCATSAIPHARREMLEQLRRATNPRQLRLSIYHLLDHLFTLPTAADGASQDVFQLLAALAQPPSIGGFGRLELNPRADGDGDNGTQHPLPPSPQPHNTHHPTLSQTTLHHSTLKKQRKEGTPQ